MANYDFLKEYIVPKRTEVPGAKHKFYPVKKEAIDEAEKRMGMKFPKELRAFYEQIGYGFMCKDGKNIFINRLMDPHSVADLRIGEGIYEGYDILLDELEEDPHLFPFFEVGDDCYIFLDLSRKTSNGNHPVIYTGIQIADSLEEFLRKLDAKENYYLFVEDEE